MNYFLYANGLFLLGTAFLIYTLMRNRQELSGFSFVGSFMTAIGMLFMLFGYLNIEDYYTLFMSIPTFAFWFVVCVYKVVDK